MKKIPLTQGKFAIVDDADFEWLNKWKWYAWTPKKKYSSYVGRGFCEGGKQISLKMHQVILNPPKGIQVDHINGDGLDNRRGNLRLCTNKQNQYNQFPVRGVSRYKGVYWHKIVKRWCARIQIAKKSIWLGSFRVEEDAARAYDYGAIKYCGEFARTNKMLGLLGD